MCAANRDVRITANSDRESEIPQKTMSALPPKAETPTEQYDDRHVRFTPIATSIAFFGMSALGQTRTSRYSFNHTVEGMRAYDWAESYYKYCSIGASPTVT